jgi:EpsI family protein
MKRNPALISIALTMLALIAVFGIAQQGVPRVVATNLENLPMVIDRYTATEGRFSQAVYDSLNADQHVYRHYVNAAGKQIELYIGYYGTAKGGRTPHNPYACFPASGWTILDAYEVAVAQGEKSARLNYMLAKKGDDYNVVLHWYQAGGNKVLASGIQQNLQRFIGLIRDNRNDGAFVRISMITKENAFQDAFGHVKRFSEEIIRHLPEYWPVEENV